MKNPLFLLLAIGCAIGAVVFLVMLVMSVRFLEWGRVLFYLIFTIACGEFAVLSFLHWKNPSS